MLPIIILYALLAGTFSLGKIILAYTQPIFLVGIRMTIAGTILLGYHFIKDRSISFIRKRDIMLFIQATILTIYIPYLLRYWSLLHLSSSKACLVYNFGPFFTYIFSYLFCNEKITVKKVLGLLIGFLGLLPLVFKTDACPSVESQSLYILPELALIVAVSCMSYGWLVIHKLVNKYDYKPSMTNGVIMFSGGILALITSLFCENASLYVTDIVPFSFLLTIIIIVSNLICHNLYGSLLKIYSPTFLSFTGFLSPLFAALYGWLFMHEIIPMHFYFSFIAILVGLGIFYSDELQNGQNEPQVFI